MFGPNYNKLRQLDSQDCGLIYIQAILIFLEKKVDLGLIRVEINTLIIGLSLTYINDYLISKGF